jgi:hypothetical protein
MIWLKWPALIVGVLVAALLIAAAYGKSRWTKSSERLLAKVEAARLPAAILRYDVRELEGLPTPVQRYFRAVLHDGQPIITAVSLEQVGSMNMSDTAQRWKRFTAKQRFVTRRPGFLWDAKIMMLPGVPVYVHDAYIAEEGLLNGAVLGLIPAVNVSGTPEMAQGELLRFFAEAAWYPTALLPSQGVRWQKINDRSAQAAFRRQRRRDDDIQLSRRRVDRHGARGSTRARSGWQVKHCAVAGPFLELCAARWDEHPARKRSGVDAAGGCADLLARQGHCTEP